MWRAKANPSPEHMRGLDGLLFSKTGKTIYYRDKVLEKATGGGIAGNFFDTATGEEYWVSGVKTKGSNAHPHTPIKVVVDDDATEEYKRITTEL
ncbi:MAG: 1-deoxy-D-xylulose-5-phosphate synthase [bacterium]|nr:1-deoxy-D-xylulose-5-phosphate synthase [bacterium]